MKLAALSLLVLGLVACGVAQSEEELQIPLENDNQFPPDDDLDALIEIDDFSPIEEPSDADTEFNSSVLEDTPIPYEEESVNVSETTDPSPITAEDLQTSVTNGPDYTESSLVSLADNVELSVTEKVIDEPLITEPSLPVTEEKADLIEVKINDDVSETTEPSPPTVEDSLIVPTAEDVVVGSETTAPSPPTVAENVSISVTTESSVQAEEDNLIIQIAEDTVDGLETIVTTSDVPISVDETVPITTEPSLPAEDDSLIIQKVPEDVFDGSDTILPAADVAIPIAENVEITTVPSLPNAEDNLIIPTADIIDGSITIGPLTDELILIAESEPATTESSISAESDNAIPIAEDVVDVSETTVLPLPAIVENVPVVDIVDEAVTTESNLLDITTVSQSEIEDSITTESILIEDEKLSTNVVEEVTESTTPSSSDNEILPVVPEVNVDVPIAIDANPSDVPEVPIAEIGSDLPIESSEPAVQNAQLLVSEVESDLAATLEPNVVPFVALVELPESEDNSGVSITTELSLPSTNDQVNNLENTDATVALEPVTEPSLPVTEDVQATSEDISTSESSILETTKGIQVPIVLESENTEECPKECECNEDDSGNYHVDCTGRDLTELPALDAKTTVLNIQNNKLTEIPKEISSLKNLQVLDADNNSIKDVALGSLSELPQLKILKLGNNALTDYPEDLKNALGLTKLEELDLGGNKITTLIGDTFAQFKSLKNVTVPANSEKIVHELCNSLKDTLQNVCTESCTEQSLQCPQDNTPFEYDLLNFVVQPGFLSLNSFVDNTEAPVSKASSEAVEASEGSVSQTTTTTTTTTPTTTTVEPNVKASDEFSLRSAVNSAPDDTSVLSTVVEAPKEIVDDHKEADVSVGATTSNTKTGGVDKSIIGLIVAGMVVVVAVITVKKNWKSIRNRFSSTPRAANDRGAANGNGTVAPEEVPLQEKSPV